jgi:hypothetical protein
MQPENSSMDRVYGILVCRQQRTCPGLKLKQNMYVCHGSSTEAGAPSAWHDTSWTEACQIEISTAGWAHRYPRVDLLQVRGRVPVMRLPPSHLNQRREGAISRR